MSALIIVRALLLARPGLLALVPAARIEVDPTGLADALPQVGLHGIGLVEGRQTLSRPPAEIMRDRIQLDVTARTPREREAVHEEIRLALHRRSGLVAGLQVRDLVLAGRGPTRPGLDARHAAIASSSADYLVTWVTPN